MNQSHFNLEFRCLTRTHASGTTSITKCFCGVTELAEKQTSYDSYRADSYVLNPTFIAAGSRRAVQNTTLTTSLTGGFITLRPGCAVDRLSRCCYGYALLPLDQGREQGHGCSIPPARAAPLNSSTATVVERRTATSSLGLTHYILHLVI